jgi:hypothetical protein
MDGFQRFEERRNITWQAIRMEGAIADVDTAGKWR